MAERIVIIGGGIMGAALAWWLTRGLHGPVPAVTVVERDPSLGTSSTMLSAASIRQQFSTPENIRLSRFGWDFLGTAQQILGEDVSLRRRGYLVLASAAGADALTATTALQRAEGAATELLAPGALAARFPWLSVEGVALGALGRDEGWFDPASLHRGFRRGARAAGATWVDGEVTALTRTGDRISAVKLADGSLLPADRVVNAAGARAGQVAALAGLDLPVGPSMRTVFHVTCPEGGPVNATAPLTVDPGGIWFRPEGSGFLVGVESASPATDPWAFAPDWPSFEEIAWPMLAARVPVFERLRAEHAWAGPYDWNAWDRNALLGSLPACPNLVHVTGFSGHGLQHAPGIGRGMAEWMLTGAWQSLDLSVFDISRLAAGRQVVERGII